MSVQHAEPTVVPPCPSWCQLPAGHDYDQLTHDGARLRQHLVPLGDGLAVSQDEINVDGIVVGSTPSLWVGEDALLTAGTADEARALAQRLLTAAEVLEKIQRAAVAATVWPRTQQEDATA